MRSDSPSAPCRGGVVALCLAALAAAAIGCATPVSDDGGPIFYPLPPQRPRVQYLTRYVGATDLEGRPSALMRFLVGDVTSERKMRKPASVAAHDGVIYVADPGWETVLVLNLREGYFDGLKDRGEGKLQVPVAITIDEQGNKFVADTGRNQVVQFNPQNEFVRGYGNPATLIPSGVAVDKQHLYITDRREHQVLVLDRRTKKQLRVIGEFGPREGQFNIPTSLSVDERGHLFVTDLGRRSASSAMAREPWPGRRARRSTGNTTSSPSMQPSRTYRSGMSATPRYCSPSGAPASVRVGCIYPPPFT
ncbi:MAG: hypothetical protein JRG95_22015 [Deltaproteobacteria bacterium]|nr:hypothetical protein [Deltaproteobacteria bacterium]